MERVAAHLLVFTFELIDKVVDESVVEILTTQVGVTGGGLNLEDTLLDGQEGNIEGSSSQIEDENVALTLDLLVKTVCNGGSSWLVDDSEDVETSDQTSIFGGLTLRISEVGWDCDDGVVDGSSKVCLGGLSHLNQDHGRDFLGGELLLLALELDLDDWLTSTVDNGEGEVLHISLDLSICELSSDKTLSIEDCVCRVHGNLVLCGITNETLGICEGNEGGCGSVSLVVGNDFDTIISVDTYTRVGGTKINSYCNVSLSCRGCGSLLLRLTNSGTHDCGYSVLLR